MVIGVRVTDTTMVGPSAASASATASVSARGAWAAATEIGAAASPARATEFNQRFMNIPQC